MLTATTWVAHSSISLPEWIEHGRRLGRMGRGIGWWIGDWLRFGNAAYGERYAPAARATGYDRQSLMNMVYVASSVEPSRRRENLSFSHHAEVAALEPADQDRWLERAEHDRLSVRCLREAIRVEHRGVSMEQRAADRRSARVCPSCGHSMTAEDSPGSDTKETRTMTSNNDHEPGKTPSDDAHVNSERFGAEDGLGSGGHLTHAQRVERVNAYLQEAANAGHWSAIE